MLLTRCPSCQTTFRVTAEQLKVRAGKVRCGQCNNVFNALETLGAMPNGGVLPAAPALVPEPVQPVLEEPTDVGAATPPRHSAADRGEVAAPTVPTTADRGGVAAPAGPAPIDRGEVAAPTGEFEEEHFAQEEPPAGTLHRRALAWTLGMLVMLALICVQAAYVFRAELAVAQPGLRPALEDLCSALDCSIPLPRKAELVSIEASDLHPDPQQSDVLTLAATLKNRAPFVQDYPHLELTLTDTYDKPLVRRVFGPDEYLRAGSDARAGFAANGDLAVNLRLEAAGVGATGYRVYVFYP